MSRYDPAQMDAARARIGALFEGREAPEATQAASVSALDALLAKAGTRLDAVGAEDRAEIIDLIETIRDARGSGDATALEDGRRQLEDLLFFLET
jgi:hypothetical protein